MRTLREQLQTGDPGRDRALLRHDARARIREAVLTAGAAAAAAERGRRTPDRGRRRAAFAVVAAAAGVLGFQLWRAASQPAFAAVRLEIRLAEDAPAPGLREAPVGTQARIVYVHEEVIVTNEDVAQARAVPGSDATRAGVEVVFTPRGAARLHAATAAHLDRPVAVSIDGLVVMAPVVRSPIGERAIVTGDFSREEAERIVRGLTAR